MYLIFSGKEMLFFVISLIVFGYSFDSYPLYVCPFLLWQSMHPVTSAIRVHSLYLYKLPTVKKAANLMLNLNQSTNQSLNECFL